MFTKHFKYWFDLALKKVWNEIIATPEVGPNNMFRPKVHIFEGFF